MGDRVNSDHTTPLPIVNRSQSNTTLYIDVSLVDLGKLLCVNLKFGEIFTRWFIFRGGSLVGVCKLPSLIFHPGTKEKPKILTPIYDN